MIRRKRKEKESLYTERNMRDFNCALHNIYIYIYIFVLGLIGRNILDYHVQRMKS